MPLGDLVGGSKRVSRGPATGDVAMPLSVDLVCGTPRGVGDGP
jgi:hypothetical protein